MLDMLYCLTMREVWLWCLIDDFGFLLLFCLKWTLVSWHLVLKTRPNIIETDFCRFDHHQPACTRNLWCVAQDDVIVYPSCHIITLYIDTLSYDLINRYKTHYSDFSFFPLPWCHTFGLQYLSSLQMSTKRKSPQVWGRWIQCLCTNWYIASAGFK